MSELSHLINAATVPIQVPDQFLRMARKHDELLLDFRNARGHEFPWGFIIEDVMDGNTNWDFYPTKLYQLCPNVGFWTDWFEEILGSDLYPAPSVQLGLITDGDGTFASFGVYSQRENVRVARVWLAHTFLPVTMLDLLRTAELVGRAWHAQDARFYDYAFGALFAGEGVELDRYNLTKMRAMMAERYGADLCF